MTEKALWQELFAAATAVVQPASCLPTFLPAPSKYGAIKVIAAGKAAAAMIQCLEEAWPNIKLTGFAVCPYGYERPCQKIELISAAHPVPDENSVVAAMKALNLAADTGPGELLLVLLSGGGSSLLCAPVEGISLTEKQKLTADLLASGAPINDINLVRSFYSRIKAGGLVSSVQKGAEVLTLAISDVVGDDITKIASGPTVCAPPAETDVQAVLSRFGVKAPNGCLPTERHAFEDHSYHIIANADNMLAQAREFLTAQGYNVVYLGGDVVGEAREIASKHAAVILGETVKSSTAKLAFLSGGELTVTVKGDGLGGPNQEYLLALMARLPAGEYAGFAADTDGRDGKSGAAGAFFDVDAHMRAAKEKRYSEYLHRNDSYSFFNGLSCNFKEIPSYTNVNDLRVIIYRP